jgi:hypothetical protein
MLKVRHYSFNFLFFGIKRLLCFFFRIIFLVGQGCAGVIAFFFQREGLRKSNKNPAKMKAFILAGDGLFAQRGLRLLFLTPA